MVHVRQNTEVAVNTLQVVRNRQHAFSGNGSWKNLSRFCDEIKSILYGLQPPDTKLMQHVLVCSVCATYVPSTQTLNGLCDRLIEPRGCCRQITTGTESTTSIQWQRKLNSVAFDVMTTVTVLYAAYSHYPTRNHVLSTFFGFLYFYRVDGSPTHEDSFFSRDLVPFLNSFYLVLFALLDRANGTFLAAKFT